MAYTTLTGGTGTGGDYVDDVDQWTAEIATQVRDNFEDHEARINAAVDLATGVTGDLPLANLAQASAASKLLGRGSASGAGDFQEVAVGSGLSMSGTTLTATGATANTGLCQGRLTLETAVPVSSSDQTGKTTIYFTPYNGNRVALYSGSSWAEYALTERSLALGTLTSGKNYDVFLYNNSGTLTLELSAAWTNDTSRADALTTQDGVYVKSGATTRRFLGTIRTTSTTTAEDSAAKRFVWNSYNRRLRHMFVSYAGSWSYSSTTYRQANAVTTNQIDFVVGLAGETTVSATLSATGNVSVAGQGMLNSIGLDNTTPLGLNSYSGLATATSQVSYLSQTIGLGRHTFVWLEKADTASTATWYGGAINAVLDN